MTETLTARKFGAEDRVLDAGCGTGNYALALAQAGFRVIGVDYADGMLAVARRKITPELAGKLSAFGGRGCGGKPSPARG